MVKLPGRSSDFVNFGLESAKQRSRSAVKQILKLRPDWLNRIGPHGRTMLWEAAYRGNTETVGYLLQLGADPHVWGCYFTPLFVEINAYAAATWKRRKDTAKLLSEIYEPLDLFSATFLGDIERVKYQVEAEPDRLNQEKSQHDREVGFTALHYAISGGYSKILKLLLNNGANPEPYAHWLVKFAVWRSDPDSLQVLLESGVALQKLKWEPAFAKTPRLPDLLKRFGITIDPNASENGWPPLVYESRGDRGGNISHITELLNLGANVNIQNYKGETALHCASKAGFVAVTELLLHHGAHIDITDNQGSTPLQHALRSSIKSRSKRASVIQTLLR
ncbi:MAG: hypothetical protein F4Z01_00570 [Gammaproteobacteria bacterium]|nr:hypothetical protein [Gammaproteobacteria bacterium]MYF37867.1 hypothetical protein [Gammaproteobacteria bacterium]